ncbi:MAG: toxin-antitoxin system HicB family antitoxin [Rubrivivax sp.]|nr:MAG: toxin-antitoxin system HicB family antitoxin [Rubrivivax sp.]
MASPDKKSFALRLDPALWAQIERLAAQELRSANAQIEYLLRDALARRGIRPAASPAPKRGRPPNDPGEADDPGA